MKILVTILRIIFPAKFANKIIEKIDRTKKVMVSTKERKIFFKILFFPITFTISILVAVFKIIAIWIFPKSVYYNLKYIFKQFYGDINQKKLGLKVALKRVLLCIELFTKGREKHVSYGKINADKTFYVIRPYYFLTKNELATSLSDLFFHYYRNLQQLSYAINQGWIPVVDWENYAPLRHMEDYPVNGTTNGWEYFWKQPSEYTLEEVYKSKNVVLANRNSINYGYIPTPFLNPPFSKYAHDLAKRCPQYDKYFEFNDITAKHIEEKQNELFPKDKRILGVSIRGASYGTHPVPGHPKQPTMESLIKQVKKELEEYEMDYIFFACEAENCVNIMKSEFGEKLLVLPRKRLTQEPKEGELNPLYYPGQKFQTNFDYLTEMALLSRCDRLMAGMSSGTRVAIIWNANQYENIHIFDEGLW